MYRVGTQVRQYPLRAIRQTRASMPRTLPGINRCMWGTWSILGGGLTLGVLVLLIGLAVGASPLFAVLAFVLAVVVLGGLALARRGAQSSQSEPLSGEALRGRDASGAPVAGEGGTPPLSG